MRRVACLVIVEVAVDIQPLLQPSREGASPPGKLLRTVPPLVRTVRPVQPHVREVRGDRLRRGLAVQIVDAKRRPGASQEFVVLFVEPAGVPELECVALALWQDLQEASQPLRVRSPPGWELEEYGPEFVLKDTHPIEKSLERLPRIFELLHVGEVARGLNREEETLGNRLPPPKERFLLRQSVEGVVDLRAAQAVSVILEEDLLGEPRWIERALPVIVMPAGRADVGYCAHHLCFRRPNLPLTDLLYESLFL